MQNRQLDLFAGSQRELPRSRCNFDRNEWFLSPHPPEWQEREYERALKFVRASLPVILESFRSVETFPWQPERAKGITDHLSQTVQVGCRLEECQEYREAFRDELLRWEAMNQLPEHDAINPRAVDSAYRAARSQLSRRRMGSGRNIPYRR